MNSITDKRKALPAWQNVYTYIRKRIVSGEIAPGTFLEEEALSAVVGVSRTPVREALRRLESDSDLVVSEGTIYPLLSRLTALGLVGSEWVESDAGHPRKYYALTRAGKQRAVEMTATWTRFSSRMSKLLAPVKKEK